ncbi:hypothetical protein M5689_020669 [Euphorbia peplus]|nr:hypothetical protein M5689_020669 [Euphorbia peplus]
MAQPQSRWLLPKQPTTLVSLAPYVSPPTVNVEQAPVREGTHLKNKSVLEVVKGLEGNIGSSGSLPAGKVGVVIPEVKRRRQELALDGCVDKTTPVQEMDCDVNDVTGTVPNNGVSAGSVAQTRLGL